MITIASKDTHYQENKRRSKIAKYILILNNLGIEY